MNNDEYLIWGHNNGILQATELIDVPTGVQARFDRVWRVSEVNSSLTAVDVGNIDIRWDLTGFGSVTASDLRLLIDTDNDGSFTDETIGTGGIIAGATLIGGNSYQFAGISQITNNLRFTLGTINSPQTPLPIELINFNASPLNKKYVQLDWQTASEKNNNYFTIERSQNGIDWEDVPTTGLTSENDYQGIWSLNGSLYTYNDFNTPFGLYKWNDQSASWELQIGTVGPNYPFLDQLYQFDGAFYGLWFNGGVWTVSGEPDNVLEYELEATIYPNPAADQLTIQTSSTPEQIMIFDQQGRIISTHYNISQLDVSALSTGIYYVRISLNNQEVIKRLIIN